MTSKYQESADLYLGIINKKLGLQLRCSGSNGYDGLIDSETGQEVGHYFQNMSQLYSAIFTAEQIIGLREKNDRQKIQELETKAHYWENFGKPLYEKEEARKKKAFLKKERKN